MLLFQGSAEIKGLDYDSRRVRRGWAFVAMRGEKTDGNRYIDQAIANGAAAIVSDSPELPPPPDFPWARVAHGRRALARLSANFYHRPAERLLSTGITGTNGKTTTAFILEAILQRRAPQERARRAPSNITFRARSLPRRTPRPSRLTSCNCSPRRSPPAPPKPSWKSLRTRLSSSVSSAFPLMSPFFPTSLATISTITSPLKIILPPSASSSKAVAPSRRAAAILNLDDEYGRELLRFCRGRGSLVYSYGLDVGDFHARNLRMTPAGNCFQLVTPAGEIEIRSPLIGRVNVYNVIAACAAAFARHCTVEQITNGILSAARVPGRFERVDAGQPFAVVIDYAHTDDALRNVTRVAREFIARSASPAGDPGVAEPRAPAARLPGALSPSSAAAEIATASSVP